MPRLTESFVRQKCSQIVEEKSAKVTILNSHQQIGTIPLFAPNEIEAGRIIGEGAFCSILALERVNLGLKKKKKNLHDDRKQQDIKSSNDNIKRDGKFSSYAIKKMTPGIIRKYGPLEFAAALTDLAIEAKLLSVIQHPHIIQVRGLADVDCCSEDFFIILERVKVTLAEKFSIWKKEIPRYEHGSNMRNFKNRLLSERLSVGHDICSALDYLHQNRIVFRDLKPENVGFDLKGKVKLCDFGLATEMTKERRVEGTNTYLLTENTGSPRYMAPEVYRGSAYNEKCDVYSFGLLLWQCTELMVPFDTFSRREIISYVYSGRVTPCFNPDWSEQLRILFCSCWSFDFRKRHNFKHIMMILENEMKVLSSS